MITGIQITKAANDDLLNSFWLLDSEKNEARGVVAKAGFAEDEKWRLERCFNLI